MTSSSDGSRQRVLFIGGLGRSGSTLIEKLLNEIPEMFAVGETVHLWERGVRDGERCGCGQPFERCEQWSMVGKAAFGGWDQIDTGELIDLRWRLDRTRRLGSIAAAHRRGRPDPDQARYVGRLRDVLLAAAEVAGRPEVLLESSKHLSTAALLALDPALDVRVLHLIRDPRGVAYSWTKQVSRPEADDQLMPTYRPSRTAGRWLTDNLGFEVLARRVPTLRLRYEDFLVDPRGSLLTIGALAGLDSDALPLDFLDGSTATLSTPMHSVAGNPLRFGSQELTLRLDDAWRRKLDPGARRTVTAITAPLLARYRYPIRVGGGAGPTPSRR